ncbi:MAG: ABC transporter permease [Saprospiraceae bacterium]
MRFLLLLTTLLLLSLLVFGLSRCTPGDPVADLLQSNLAGGSGKVGAYEANYASLQRQLHRDLPAFYFDVTTAARPDTLHRIVLADHREALESLLAGNGNWPALQDYYRALRRWEDGLEGADAPARRAKLANLMTRAEPERIERVLNEEAGDSAAGEATLTAWQNFQSEPRRGRHLLPAVHWHGTENAYHQWLFGLLRGDFGISYTDRRPVFDKVMDALEWTVVLNLTAVLLAFLLSVPLGMWLARRAGSRRQRLTTFALFAAYSLPSFWVATLLTLFFTTGEYGMDWFPNLGLGTVPAGASWPATLSIRAGAMILPVFCLTYGSLAFLSRQMQRAVSDEMQKPYYQAALAKGLSPRRALWRHVFRNALFPIITLLAGVFPASLAGSVVIEMIFRIPGMGLLMLKSIGTRDWPVVYIILLMGGLLTILGLLLSEILYRLADPRVGVGPKVVARAD